MHMKRYWMTGCMALILLVAGRAPQRDDQDDEPLNERTRITLISKYDMAETVRQIERTARRNGLPVLAHTDLTTTQVGARPEGAARVLVLGDEGGQTPMWQAADHDAPQLPWSLVVRQRADGQAEVLLADLNGMPLPEGVSPQTIRRAETLPELVRSAIT